jgi:hypothetical protein
MTENKKVRCPLCDSILELDNISDEYRCKTEICAFNMFMNEYYFKILKRQIGQLKQKAFREGEQKQIRLMEGKT